MSFTIEQKKALKAVCDTLIPSIQKENDGDNYWNRQASDLDIAAKFIELVMVLPQERQEEFHQLLVQNYWKFWLEWDMEMN